MSTKTHSRPMQLVHWILMLLVADECDLRSRVAEFQFPSLTQQAQFDRFDAFFPDAERRDVELRAPEVAPDVHVPESPSVEPNQHGPLILSQFEFLAVVLRVGRGKEIRVRLSAEALEHFQLHEIEALKLQVAPKVLEYHVCAGDDLDSRVIDNVTCCVFAPLAFDVES